MKRLEGKYAVVTGASKGIGRAIAQAFAREGATVACCARSADTLAATVSEITAETGIEALSIPADFRKPDDVANVFKVAAEKWGRIDILVNAAAAPVFGRFLELGDDAWEDTFEIKLMGYVRACRAVLPHMVAQGSGSIINITGGIRANALHLPGGAANIALTLITEGLAKEFGRSGVRVNAVSPGATTTDRWSPAAMATRAAEHGQPEEQFTKQLLKDIPLGRLTRPDEIAKAAVYLASEDAAAISGITIRLDGGRSA